MTAGKPARRETLLVASGAALLSIASLLYCWSHQLLLLYGDAVAHLHIARRVFDSRNPGFRQLGSVWLPLPHLLLLPFVQKTSWWQSGLAGAWPSMAAYVLAVTGLYRLLRLSVPGVPAALGTAMFALNPGLLYLQTTAMTEPLFLAEMIWAALLLAQALEAVGEGRARGAIRNMLALAAVLALAVYTRYDGWILAAVVWLLLSVRVAAARRLMRPAAPAFALGTALVALAPASWLAYNRLLFGDALDFLRGPYSAAAIEMRTRTPGAPHYPGYHSLRVAGLYFLKAAELGVTRGPWANLLLWLVLGGTLAGCLLARRAWLPMLVLSIPLPFYAYSIAYGAVPVFLPLWWPFSWYNTRYGMELLPAVALSIGFLVWAAMRAAARLSPRAAGVVVVAAALLIAGNAVAVLAARPLVYQEALANSATRIPFERELAAALRRLPPEDSILMCSSEYAGALEQAGIPLRRTINETDWKIFERALAAPALSAGWVVAIGHDAVAQSVRAAPEGLVLERVLCMAGQPCARIYRAGTGVPLPAPPR